MSRLKLSGISRSFGAIRALDSVSLELAPGEGTKDWPNLQRCVDWLLDQKVERGDIVVALGGGVIGDLVSFAAAILRRGVRFVQIPTSLLAQVDSSVGGKTGINARHGKNLIGAFHQPSLVLADTGVLGTLTPRDFLSGFGEVVKYGLLGDAAFFDWLEAQGPALAAGDTAARIAAVRRRHGLVPRSGTSSARSAVRTPCLSRRSAAPEHIARKAPRHEQQHAPHQDLRPIGPARAVH